MAKDNSMDSPVENNLFKPGKATEMPIKHYSQKDVEHKGKGTTIEGPGCEAGEKGVYHK